MDDDATVAENCDIEECEDEDTSGSEEEVDEDESDGSDEVNENDETISSKVWSKPTPMCRYEEIRLDNIREREAWMAEAKIMEGILEAKKDLYVANVSSWKRKAKVSLQEDIRRSKRVKNKEVKEQPVSPI